MKGTLNSCGVEELFIRNNQWRIPLPGSRAYTSDKLLRSIYRLSEAVLSLGCLCRIFYKRVALVDSALLILHITDNPNLYFLIFDNTLFIEYDVYTINPECEYYPRYTYSYGSALAK